MMPIITAIGMAFSAACTRGVIGTKRISQKPPPRQMAAASAITARTIRVSAPVVMHQPSVMHRRSDQRADHARHRDRPRAAAHPVDEDGRRGRARRRRQLRPARAT